MNKLLFLIVVHLSLFSLISCNTSRKDNKHNQGKGLNHAEIFNNGSYVIFGYQKTKKALKDSISLELPTTFHFSENRVRIYPDFSFGYFKDSVYSYEIYEHYLLLKSKNDMKEIEFQRVGEKMIDLFIDHPYLKQITIIKRVLP